MATPSPETNQKRMDASMHQRIRQRRVTRRVLVRHTASGVVTATAATVLTGSEPAAPSTAGDPEARLGLRFPDNFAWGAATSAYQIEGAAREDGRGESIWDRFSHTPGRVRNGDTGDIAADHYHRYLADLDLMKSLGLRSYRFSLSWSRILPAGRGPVNRRGLDFYRRLVQGLHERGITPVATLFHWDLPQALQDHGGWENRDCAHWFADYADVVFRALGDQVPTWLTINEPKTIVYNGYTFGHHAPGKRDRNAAMVVAHHLLLAHGLAVRAFRGAATRQRIGPALNLAPAYPADGVTADALPVRIADAMENRLYLDPILRGSYPADLFDSLPANAPVRAAIRDGDLDVISTPVDLLAVQYYNPVYVAAAGEYVKKHRTSIAFWQEIYPEGMYDTLTRIRRDYGDIPLSITENGIPTRDELSSSGTVDDRERVAFLRDHMAAAHRAINAGVRLESYHVWSLLDNFEWAEGYDQRWGMVYVDFANQRRFLKRSAHWYRDVIAQNTI
jgi:beta-glucosidase